MQAFFFSSRRRHTRFDCDWSSDVCSSDLVGVGVMTAELRGSAAGFFSAAAFSEFFTAAGADGFGAGGVSRRVGFSTESGRTAGCTAAVAADDEGSERWPRIFGGAPTARITRKAAATGNT